MSNKLKLKDYVNQYEFPFTIPSTGVMIKFKPITTGQMKNLLVYENESITIVEKILDEIIVGCVITEDFDIDEITLQDRFNLLIEIRKKSKGNNYSFQTKCNKCGVLGPKIIELDKLNVIPFKKSKDTTVKLNDQISIELDYVKRRSQRLASEIVEKDEKLNQNQQLAEIASYTYALSITKFITPDGEFTQDDTNVEDIMDLLNNLDEGTYQKINDWFVDNDYGIVFKTKYKCANCNEKEEIDIPVSYFFS